MLVGGIDEMHGAWLGHPLPLPQLGASQRWLRPCGWDRAPWLCGQPPGGQGAAAVRAALRREQPWQEPASAGEAALRGQRGSSSGETQVVRPPAICRRSPPAAGQGDAGVKADSAGSQPAPLNHRRRCGSPAAARPCPAGACTTP